MAVGLFLAGFMVMALTLALLADFSKLKDVLGHMAISPFLLALLSTGSAYLASALSFRALFAMTPYRVPFRKFFSIMFISDTVNYIISTAGMSSIANRALLLKNEKIPYTVTVPLSLAQNMIFNIILCGVSLAALGYLQENPGFAGAPEQRTILLFMAGLSLVVAGLVLFFFLNPLRRWALQRILGAGRWIKRWVLRRKLDERSWAGNLDRVEKTVAFLQKSRLGLLRVFFWVALNWCFMALAFYFCFHAAGLNLDPGLLLVGFTVMFISSNINPVPAGLGVSESLLAFTYKFLGVGFEPTLVAAILFRLVYYLIPLALATVLYLDKIRLFLKTPVK